MPDPKFASDSNSAQSHRDGSDVTHTVSHDAGTKMSQEAADLMRARKTGDNKPNQGNDETMKHFLWEMFVLGL